MSLKFNETSVGNNKWTCTTTTKKHKNDPIFETRENIGQEIFTIGAV